MKSAKRIAMLLLTCVMLFGATLTVHAACNHSIEKYSYDSPTSSIQCGEHENCTITTYTHYEGGKCKLCGGVVSLHPTYTYVKHSNAH